MSKKSAFPYNEIDQNSEDESIYEQHLGISQRLYIATKLMAGVMASDPFYNSKVRIEECYKVADELIKQDEDED